MQMKTAKISVNDKVVIQSFAAVCDKFSNTLILGSMPGVRSLQLAQYYAHPRNAFWQIMLQLTNADANCSYERRIELLKQHGIALWDVLYSCERKGSLDQAIHGPSVQANDFQSFYEKFPQIKRIFFNGAYAQTAYRKHVFPQLTASVRSFPTFRLPSTSPAHASLNFSEKLDAWRAVMSD